MTCLDSRFLCLPAEQPGFPFPNCSLATLSTKDQNLIWSELSANAALGDSRHNRVANLNTVFAQAIHTKNIEAKTYLFLSSSPSIPVCQMERCELDKQTQASSNMTKKSLISMTSPALQARLARQA